MCCLLGGGSQRLRFGQAAYLLRFPTRRYTAAHDKATDDMVKSEAEIGVQVYQAMTYALAQA